MIRKVLAFLYRSFTDARGVPDGKLLTVFLLTLVVSASWPVGWLTGKWPPEYIYSNTLLFLGAALGFASAETIRQIAAERPAPPTVVGAAENVNVNPPAV